MEREIKFRAWDGKEMYYNPYIPNHGKWAMLDETIKDCQQGYKSLMQYTGLKDCKDQEVYERDIFLNIDTNEKFIVRYEQDKAAFFSHYIGSDKVFSLWKSIENVYYKIGNEFENPELL